MFRIQKQTKIGDLMKVKKLGHALALITAMTACGLNDKQSGIIRDAEMLELSSEQSEAVLAAGASLRQTGDAGWMIVLLALMQEAQIENRIARSMLGDEAGDEIGIERGFRSGFRQCEESSSASGRANLVGQLPESNELTEYKVTTSYKSEFKNCILNGRIVQGTLTGDTLTQNFGQEKIAIEDETPDESLTSGVNSFTAKGSLEVQVSNVVSEAIVVEFQDLSAKLDLKKKNIGTRWQSHAQAMLDGTCTGKIVLKRQGQVLRELKCDEFFKFVFERLSEQAFDYGSSLDWENSRIDE
jgi:hypothetical protein